MTAPVRFDTQLFSEDLDFTRFAHRQLLGFAGTGAAPSDILPVDWMLRAYPQLRGTPWADRLSEAIAAALTAPEPEVRSQALLFFFHHPTAAGAERLEVLFTGDRSLFRGVHVWPEGSPDLEGQLGTALGARASAGIASALKLAKAEALRPGRAAGLLAAVAGTDPEWASAHAEAIVRGTPKALRPLLFQLELHGGGAAEVGERLARLDLLPAAEFRRTVEETVLDEARRRRILAALSESG